MGVMTGCAGNCVIGKGKINSIFGGLTVKCFHHLLRHPDKMISPGGMVILFPSVTTDAELSWCTLERGLRRTLHPFPVGKGLMTP
jgi:hypothetical protein